MALWGLWVGTQMCQVIRAEWASGLQSSDFKLSEAAGPGSLATSGACVTQPAQPWKVASPFRLPGPLSALVLGCHAFRKLSFSSSTAARCLVVFPAFSSVSFFL